MALCKTRKETEEMASKFDVLLSQAMEQHRRTKGIIDDAIRVVKTQDDCRRLLDFFRQMMDDGINLHCLKGPITKKKIDNLKGSEKNEV